MSKALATIHRRDRTTTHEWPVSVHGTPPGAYTVRVTSFKQDDGRRRRYRTEVLRQNGSYPQHREGIETRDPDGKPYPAGIPLHAEEEEALWWGVEQAVDDHNRRSTA